MSTSLAEEAEVETPREEQAVWAVEETARHRQHLKMVRRTLVVVLEGARTGQAEQAVPV